jgi:uncharacterized protein YdeI (YjbR/CyaY-like superfamily)
MAPKFFQTSSVWRQWLAKNHRKETALLVGFFKKDAGRSAMTWSESVDEALCFGWIDGVRKSIDAERYSIRFAVRKNGSIWSRVNIAKAEALIASGKMAEAGLVSFKACLSHKSGVYSFEQDKVDFDAGSGTTFKADAKAWAFFAAQPPSYRKKATWWVISAKQEVAQSTRLQKLIAASRARRRL